MAPKPSVGLNHRDGLGSEERLKQLEESLSSLQKLVAYQGQRLKESEQRSNRSVVCLHCQPCDLRLILYYTFIVVLFSD